MDANQKEIPQKDTPPESDPTKIDRNTPSSSENSPGAEGVCACCFAKVMFPAIASRRGDSSSYCSTRQLKARD
jgi:hypothetical protein